jgi:ABC-type transport system substrate-binding protein
MRLRGWAWLALGSVFLNPIEGAIRPRYGGTLTVELSALYSIRQPELGFPVAETLVRVNARGSVEPVLAVAWQHDPDFKRWRFSLRPRVTFHDGEALTAASTVPSLVAALKPKYGDLTIVAGGLALAVQSGRAMPDLLEDLAVPEAAIIRQNEANPLIGTGPFRVAAWEQGRRLLLHAFEDYWGGRPFLDAVLIEGAAERGRADLFDVPVGPARRILPEGLTAWSSEPRTLVAVEAGNVNPSLLAALALAIDRAPIANVLAQHKADPAYGLLPEWLSGYEFLFQAPPDLTRGRQIASQLHGPSVGLGFPANDPFLRSVAERVALNARDAGLVIQPTTAPNAQLRLLEVTLESTDAADELRRVMRQAGLGAFDDTHDLSTPQGRYEIERSILDRRLMIPLVYLRETFAISPRVHFEEQASDAFALHLENAWIGP